MSHQCCLALNESPVLFGNLCGVVVHPSGRLCVVYTCGGVGYMVCVLCSCCQFGTHIFSSARSRLVHGHFHVCTCVQVRFTVQLCAAVVAVRGSRRERLVFIGDSSPFRGGWGARCRRRQKHLSRSCIELSRGTVGGERHGFVYAVVEAYRGDVDHTIADEPIPENIRERLENTQITLIYHLGNI